MFSAPDTGQWKSAKAFRYVKAAAGRKGKRAEYISPSESRQHPLNLNQRPCRGFLQVVNVEPTLVFDYLGLRPKRTEKTRN